MILKQDKYTPYTTLYVITVEDVIAQIDEIIEENYPKEYHAIVHAKLEEHDALNRICYNIENNFSAMEDLFATVNLCMFDLKKEITLKLEMERQAFTTDK